MSQVKLAAAKQLIQEKRFVEARAVLLTIPDDPVAQRWLQQVNQRIQPELENTLLSKSPEKRKSVLYPVILFLVVLAVAGLIGYAMWSSNQQANRAGAEYACSLMYTKYTDTWQNCVNDTP